MLCETGAQTGARLQFPFLCVAREHCETRESDYLPQSGITKWRRTKFRRNPRLLIGLLCNARRISENSSLLVLFSAFLVYSTLLSSPSFLPLPCAPKAHPFSPHSSSCHRISPSFSRESSCSLSSITECETLLTECETHIQNNRECREWNIDRLDKQGERFYTSCPMTHERASGLDWTDLFTEWGACEGGRQPRRGRA